VRLATGVLPRASFLPRNGLSTILVVISTEAQLKRGASKESWCHPAPPEACGGGCGSRLPGLGGNPVRAAFSMIRAGLHQAMRRGPPRGLVRSLPPWPWRQAPTVLCSTQYGFRAENNSTKNTILHPSWNRFWTTELSSNTLAKTQHAAAVMAPLGRDATAFLNWLDSPNAPRWLIVLDDLTHPHNLRGRWSPNRARPNHRRQHVGTNGRSAAAGSSRSGTGDIRRRARAHQSSGSTPRQLPAGDSLDPAGLTAPRARPQAPRFLRISWLTTRCGCSRAPFRPSLRPPVLR
jgi:hypothetical protein